MPRKPGMTPRAHLRNIPAPSRAWKMPTRDWIRDLHAKRFGPLTIVDPIGIGARHVGAGEVVAVDLVRRRCFAPLADLIVVVADQILFLRVHGNDGLARPQGSFDGAVDMPKLCARSG